MISAVNVSGNVFLCVPEKNYSKDFLKSSSITLLSDSTQIEYLTFFLFIVILNDSLAHCIKCILLQQETQAIDDIVAFVDLLRSRHI